MLVVAVVPEQVTGNRCYHCVGHDFHRLINGNSQFPAFMISMMSVVLFLTAEHEGNHLAAGHQSEHKPNLTALTL